MFDIHYHPIPLNYLYIEKILKNNKLLCKYDDSQTHVLGAVQLPPLRHGGLQTATIKFDDIRDNC